MPHTFIYVYGRRRKKPMLHISGHTPAVKTFCIILTENTKVAGNNFMIILCFHVKHIHEHSF